MPFSSTDAVTWILRRWFPWRVSSAPAVGGKKPEPKPSYTRRHPE
jgi:hypothetical protein